jgi:hypothetical protein
MHDLGGGGNLKNRRYKLKETEFAVKEMRRGLDSLLNINFKNTTSKHTKI